MQNLKLLERHTVVHFVCFKYIGVLHKPTCTETQTVHQRGSLKYKNQSRSEREVPVNVLSPMRRLPSLMTLQNLWGMNQIRAKIKVESVKEARGRGGGHINLKSPQSWMTLVCV